MAWLRSHLGFIDLEETIEHTSDVAQTREVVLSKGLEAPQHSTWIA